MRERVVMGPQLLPGGELAFVVGEVRPREEGQQICQLTALGSSTVNVQCRLTQSLRAEVLPLCILVLLYKWVSCYVSMVSPDHGQKKKQTEF